MADMNARVSISFVSELRRVLHHLYDWVEVSKSPLLEVFGVKQQNDAPSALRGLLRQAIESLKPGRDVSPKARAWRMYQILVSRYVEQFTQREVAGELGLSIRHLRREESVAVQTLASYLWEQYQLGGKWDDSAIKPVPAPETRAASPETQTPSQEEELDWVEESLPSKPVEVAETIEAAIKLVVPLAQSSDVQFDYKIPASLPYWIIQPTPIQQALLIVLTTAVSSVPQGRVSLRARVEKARIWVDIQAESSSGGTQDQVEIERLGMARQLIQLSEGTLDVNQNDDTAALDMRISLPAEAQHPVLVIDDNVDTLQLLERYLSNSRYQFIGTSNPQQALDLAVEAGPEVIFLDVMLPDIDGWELLGRLQSHPQLADTPIIVCTILPQQQLALNLGATAFLQKPVSRADLLLTLARLLGPPSTGSG